MGTITYTIPVAGSTSFSIAAGEVDTALQALLTLLNGNVDTNNLSPTAAIADTQLGAPVSAVRRLLLQASSEVPSTTAAGTYLLAPNGVVASGSAFGGVFPPIWAADSGLSSQPQDFQVAGRSGFARIRAVVFVNQVAPAVTFTMGLYPITATGSGSGQVPLTFSSVLAGSTVAVATPAIGSITAVESAQFALPTAAGVYALGVQFSGTITANSGVGISAQLFGYNA